MEIGGMFCVSIEVSFAIYIQVLHVHVYIKDSISLLDVRSLLMERCNKL